MPFNQHQSYSIYTVRSGYPFLTYLLSNGAILSVLGGGCKKLFRKIGNRSSEFYPDINEVRRDGSYIYEEFVETQGTDVKMYTGEYKAHSMPKIKTGLSSIFV